MAVQRLCSDAALRPVEVNACMWARRAQATTYHAFDSKAICNDLALARDVHFHSRQDSWKTEERQCLAQRSLCQPSSSRRGNSHR